MNRHELAIEHRYQAAHLAEDIHGRLGSADIGIAKIHSLEGTVVANLQWVKPGNSLQEPCFVHIVCRKVSELKRPVHAVKTFAHGGLPEFFLILHEIAYRQLRLWHHSRPFLFSEHLFAED